MTRKASAESQEDLFAWESASQGRFPYATGASRMSWNGWLIALLGVAVGVVLDICAVPITDALVPAGGGLAIVVTVALLFLIPGIPLAALWVASRRQLAALFRPFRTGQWILALAVLLVFMAYVLVVNAALHGFGAIDDQATAISQLGMGPNAIQQDVVELYQLPFFVFAQTLYTLVPFLFVYAFLTNILTINHRPATAIAAVVAALLFGVIHYAAADGDWAQILLLVAGGQLIVLFGYLRSKNFWVPFASQLGFDVFVVLMLMVTAASRS